ncbi:MAG: DMT family transporter [Pseudomonadota bacterium]
MSWLLLAVLVFFWGSSFSLVTVALTDMTPGFVTGARITLAAAVVAFIAHAAAGRFPRDMNFWLWSAAIGFCALVAPFSLYTWAQETVPSGVVSIYVAATPFFVMALAFPFTDEKVTLRRAGGFVIGIAGVAALIGPVELSGFFSGDAAREAAALGSAVFFAIAAVLVRAMPRRHPLHAAAGALIMAALMHLPVTGANVPTAAVSSEALYALLALGALQTSVMQVSRYLLIKRSGAVFASQASFLMPLWAVVVGWALLGETLSIADGFGLALILFGLNVANGGLLKPPSAPQPVKRYRRR